MPNCEPYCRCPGCGECEASRKLKSRKFLEELIDFIGKELDFDTGMLNKDEMKELVDRVATFVL